MKRVQNWRDYLEREDDRWTEKIKRKRKFNDDDEKDRTHNQKKQRRRK